MTDLEKAARALCAVDGESPDELVQSGEVGPVTVDGVTTIAPKLVARWHIKRAEARRILAVIEAVSASSQ